MPERERINLSEKRVTGWSCNISLDTIYIYGLLLLCVVHVCLLSYMPTSKSLHDVLHSIYTLRAETSKKYIYLSDDCWISDSRLNNTWTSLVVYMFVARVSWPENYMKSISVVYLCSPINLIRFHSSFRLDMGASELVERMRNSFFYIGRWKREKDWKKLIRRKM